MYLIGSLIIVAMSDVFVKFLHSYLFIAIMSALLIPVLFILLGKVLDLITLAIASVVSDSLGPELTLFILNNLTFIGTVHHELAHALLAFLTGAKIVRIDLYNPDDHTLGKVEYYTRGGFIIRSLQQTLSSIAPVFCGFLTINILLYVIFPYANAIWQKVILIYLVISVFIHMTLSNQDIKVALMGLPVVLPIIFIIVYINKFDVFIYLSKVASKFIYILNNGVIKK